MHLAFFTQHNMVTLVVYMVTFVVFSQQAEAVANGRRIILAKAFSSASSSLEEPLAGASQHEHEPAA